MTTEADIEAAFVKYAGSQGCLCLKLRIDGQNGWPDRTVLTPKGAVFIEFKKPGGKLSRQQVLWLAALSRLGYVAFQSDNVRYACRVLDGVLKGEITCNSDLEGVLE